MLIAHDICPERCDLSMTVRSFYVRGNTSRGSVNMLDSSLQGIRQLYVFQGGSDRLRTALIETIGNEMERQGLEIWFLHCPSNQDALDGVIVPAIGCGIVNSEVLQGSNANQLVSHVFELNLTSSVTAQALREHQEELGRLAELIQQAHEQAYAGFAEALRIHDEWEAIYIQHMDFEKANRIADQYVDLLLGNAVKKGSDAKEFHRFLGAATPKGANDFVPNLTSGLKRYFIKGRAGTGKSTLLNKLAAAARERGFDTEIYHCGFDPRSLDMVIVREIGFAVFDSTAPHEYFPETAEDEIIDMYELCVTPGTDEIYAESLADVARRYKAEMRRSTGHLAQAKAFIDQRDAIIEAASGTGGTANFIAQLKDQFALMASLMRNG